MLHHVQIDLGKTTMRFLNDESASNLVHRFRDKAEEVPDCICIFQVCLWVTLLRMNKIRKLQSVSNEEYRGVIANHIPDSFFGVELQGKSTRISSSICRPYLSTHSRKSCKNRGFLAHLVQESGLANVAHITEPENLSESMI